MSPRQRPRLAALLALGVLSACGSDETVPTGRPDSVLLITLDTCRADRLGCYGNARIDTPVLDQIAADGVLFEHAFSPIPSTLPSHCTIMTSSYPASHGVHDNGVYYLEDAATTLAEVLDEQGYATGAFVSAFVLDEQFNLNQGFDHYDDEMSMPLADVDVEKIAESDAPEGQKKWFSQLGTEYQRRAEHVTPPATEWLKHLGDQPFFLWVHYFDPHQPYGAPGAQATRYDPDYKGPMNGDMNVFFAVANQHAQRRQRMPQIHHDHMVARYDAEIAYMDDWIGRLLKGVEDVGRLDETLVVVVADHGESFGEHPYQIWEHNSDVYDEVLRVPLLVKSPDGRGAGLRVPGLVRTLDVAPTILDWLDLPPWDGVRGESLWPLVEDPEAEFEAVLLAEARRERQIFPPDQSFLALRTNQFKLLEITARDGTKRVELYELATDPGEKNDLSKVMEDQARALQDSLREYHDAHYRHVESSRELDSVDSEALRQLGYTDDGN